MRKIIDMIWTSNMNIPSIKSLALLSILVVALAEATPSIAITIPNSSSRLPAKNGTGHLEG